MKKEMILAVALAIAIFAGPVAAKKWDRGSDDRIEWNHHSDQNNDDRAPVKIIIGGNDRIIISDYLRSHYGRKCPPGLAKKNNGCLPPGQAKKYAIGYPLNYNYRDVPAELLAQLGGAPAGARYVMVDQDILLVSDAGKKILDAVTLLSAVK